MGTFKVIRPVEAPPPDKIVLELEPDEFASLFTLYYQSFTGNGDLRERVAAMMQGARAEAFPHLKDKDFGRIHEYYNSTVNVVRRVMSK